MHRRPGLRAGGVALLSLASLFVTGQARAQVAGFAHARGLAVTETSNTALADHQVAIELDTAALVAANKMNADGSDIRFSMGCAGETPLPHWIESGMNTAATRIWVRVPALPANGKVVIVMSHGKADAATTSDPLTVFDRNAADGQPYSSTKQVVGIHSGGVVNSQRGFTFTPKEDVLLVEVGKNEPNGTVRQATLWDFAAQTQIFQQAVAGPAGQYSYAAVGAGPTWLRKDKTYLLTLYQGDTDGYYYGPSAQIADELTYGDMRYCNGCTKDTFPTDVLTSYHYGHPDVRFVKRKLAPAEPTVAASACTASATCDVDCSVPDCGDGVVNAAAGEACDDGNKVDDDGCSNACALPTCGDGIVQGTEQCDDGNKVDDDACRNTCVTAKCGDGIVQTGEVCDDGNTRGADGCSADCKAKDAAPDAGSSSSSSSSGAPAVDAGASSAAPGADLPSDGVDPTVDGGGCACNTSSSGSGAASFAVFGLVALAIGRIRRRSAR